MGRTQFLPPSVLPVRTNKSCAVVSTPHTAPDIIPDSFSSHNFAPHLTTSHHISPHLVAPHHISPHLVAHYRISLRFASTDWQGHTALMLVSESGNVDLVEMLVRGGCDASGYDPSYMKAKTSSPMQRALKVGMYRPIPFGQRNRTPPEARRRLPHP